VAKVDDNFFPKIITDMQTVAPAAPSDRSVKIYEMADGLYARSSNSASRFWPAGSGLSNPMTTTGDMIYSSDNSGTAARLAIGSNGQVMRTNSTPLPAWALPPGFELDYTQFTAAVSVTHTTGATADTIVTNAAISFDGNTTVTIEFFTPAAAPQATSGTSLIFYLYDGSTQLDTIGQITTDSATQARYPVHLKVRLKPSNASHTYSIRASTGSGTGTVNGGIGGATQFTPGYSRITVS